MAGFRGGVHPPDTKRLTRGAPITEVYLPDIVVIPLQQHLGAPCEPCVRPKQTVAVGELIGKPTGRVSAPVHASVAGVVRSIDRVPHPSGRRVEAVTIEVDRDRTTYVPNPCPPGEHAGDDIAPEVILEEIGAAGIVGMGGAGFPTRIKLSPPRDKPIDTLILNGCECEPYLTGDHRLMAEQPVLVVEGMRLMMRALGVRHGVIAVEDDKPDAVRALRAARLPDGVTVHVLPVRYPQGAEKLLVAAVLDRIVPSGGLPLDVGVVVQNVATAAAVTRAVRCGEPLIRRVVTVTGHGVREPGNYRVPFGMLVGDLLRVAGGLSDDAGAVIFGGPMMGVAQATLDTPIIKTTSGIVVMERDAARASHPCLRCGRCIDVCPMGLAPAFLARAVEAGLVAHAETLGILDCMECGSCTFMCPSGRAIVAWIRQGKADLAAARAAQAAHVPQPVQVASAPLVPREDVVV